MQLGGGLDEVRLSEVVEHLQLPDDLLLVLHDLVLLLYLRLDPPDLHLLLVGLQLDQAFQARYVTLFQGYLPFLAIDDASECVDLAIEAVLLPLVVR